MGRLRHVVIDRHSHPVTVTRTETVPGLSVFRFARFRFCLQTQDCLRLPAYKGSALRGGFGQVFRCLALLNYFHCGGEFPPERKDFVEQARSIETVSSELHWVDQERYSNRQQRWTPIGGFVGQVTYRGDLTPFLPYLRLGEYTHVGKGATFGLGGYHLALPVQ